MKLTDEKIAELAPEWATHYFSNGKVILFESASFLAFYYIEDKVFSRISSQLADGISKNSKPIPRKPKPFDITQHEFSDAMANLKAMKSERGDVVIRIGSSWIFLDKADSIAIAKALGVTCEDLK